MKLSKMAPNMAAVLRASRKLFSYVLFVILLFYVLDVICTIVYNRHTLKHWFLHCTMQTGLWVLESRHFVYRHRIRTLCLGRIVATKETPPEKEQAFHSLSDSDAVPSDLLSQPFCWLSFTEIWMSAMVPDSAIELTGFSVHRSDREKELTGKSRVGGVCFYINNSWCDERNLHSIKSFCSPDLEFHMLLCRPFWLPREFTAIIITAVYIPPQANTDQALKELYRNISEQETAHPDVAFVVMGDFNKANFRTIAPEYFQHITINTRGDHALDHCYSHIRDAYKSRLPYPPFGKSYHSSVLLLPV